MCCDEQVHTVKLYICKYHLVLDLLLFKNGLHVCEISNTVKHTPSTRVKINHIHIFIDFYYVLLINSYYVPTSFKLNNYTILPYQIATTQSFATIETFCQVEVAQHCHHSNCWVRHTMVPNKKILV